MMQNQSGMSRYVLFKPLKHIFEKKMKSDKSTRRNFHTTKDFLCSVQTTNKSPNHSGVEFLSTAFQTAEKLKTRSQTLFCQECQRVRLKWRVEWRAIQRSVVGASTTLVIDDHRQFIKITKNLSHDQCRSQQGSAQSNPYPTNQIGTTRSFSGFTQLSNQRLPASNATVHLTTTLVATWEGEAANLWNWYTTQMQRES